jgi:hypothetical protein
MPWRSDESPRPDEPAERETPGAVMATFVAEDPWQELG